MSTWTQRRRFILLFQQYAERITITLQEKTLLSFIEHTKQLDSRLRIEALQELLTNIGPVIEQDQARQFILEYDSTLTGTLNLDDFIEFMSDYILVLQRARDLAIDYFNEQEDEMFIETYPRFDDYLLSVGLEDPAQLMQVEEPISKQIQESFFLNDVHLLKRHISIRIFCALDLSRVARLKPQKSVDAIEYLSLDPFVRVELAGMKQETSIISNTLHPQWDQTVDFLLEIPIGVITDIQQWIYHQNLTFYLYDSNDCGLSHSSELLGSASIPLIRVLLDSGKRSLTLDLQTTSCTKGPKLQVSVHDMTHEKFHWSKIVDAYLSNEDAWLMKYADKLKFDLGRFSLRKTPDNVKSKSILTDRVWTLFISTLESLKNLFPLRNFSLVMLDEFNTFRFLCGFVRPIQWEFSKLDEIAKAVANIPFEQTVLSPQWGGNTVKYSSTHSISSWLMGNPGDVASETLIGQVSSPSTILVRRKASLIEHANLLCCFFRGRGVEAYVAVGEVQHRPYTWVVSLFPFDNQSEYLESCSFKQKRPPQNHTISYDDHYFDISEFFKRDAVSQALDHLNQHLVLHWDPLTGACFDSTSVPFDVLHTIFNENNQYFNVQPCTRPRQ